MKKTLFTLFTIIGLTAFAQQEAPPQGINYQAVVYSDNGNNQPGLNSPGQVLWNEDIGVQFSILSGSATGTVIYKETHATSTDEFGMFNLVIGQGLVQGTQSFNMIDWGSGYHFLKVEVDKTGGTHYVEMSVQQLWSVPYALYSGYSSSSGYADSAGYANIAGNGITDVIDNGDGSLTFIYYDGSTYTTAVLSGLGGVGPQGPAGADGQDGQDGLSTYEIWLAQGNAGTEQDFLNSLQATANTDWNSITNIPSDISDGDDVDDADSDPTNEIQNFTLNGDTLLLSNSNFVVLGPLLDSIITIDYDSLANLIIADSNFTVGGVMNWKYPDGYNGTPVNWRTLTQGDYTVPSGKTLYITVPLTTEAYHISIDGVLMVDGPMNRTNGVTNSNPFVASSGQVVSGGGTFHGLLFDNSPIQPISWELANGINTSNEYPYTVPSGKKLVILQQKGTNLKVNGISIAENGNNGNTNLQSLGNPIIANEADIISGNSYSNFNGYLVDMDFFQNNGSSVNSSNGNTSNNFNIQIGNYAYGGIVFYVDSTGQHGKVVSTHDLQNYDFNTDRLTSISICENLISNGYSDWYLPELSELLMIYNNLGNGGFGFPEWSGSTAYTVWHYWSSSVADPTQWVDAGWSVNFENGNSEVTVNGNDCRVRAIRNF